MCPGSPMARLSIEDIQRARTWAKEMATAALPENTPQSIDGPDVRFRGRGGLLIHARKGCWYRHAKSRGGWSTVEMIQSSGIAHGMKRLTGCWHFSILIRVLDPVSVHPRMMPTMRTKFRSRRSGPMLLAVRKC